MLQIVMKGGIGDENAFEGILRFELTRMRGSGPWEAQYQDLALFEARFSEREGSTPSNGPLGIDVRRWTDNSPNFIILLEQHGRLVVLDRYKYTDVVPTFAELIQSKVISCRLPGTMRTLEHGI